MKTGYRFVSWFPGWVGFHWVRHDPAQTSWAYMYEWHLFFGFWEIRKRSRLKLPGNYILDKPRS
jgi:hypothetical protein